MTAPTDRIQLLKQESTALGGQDAEARDYPVPITPQDDAPEVAGVFFQDATNRDEQVYLVRASGRLAARDEAFAESAVVTELAHAVLRQLAHLADGVGGPFEGWTSGAFRETLPSGPFPTSVIWWTSAAKTHKIVQKLIAYNANKTPTATQWSAYASDGTTVIAQVTDTMTYSSVFETSRTRTVT
jgi:hypothetical protein